jgi:hypothetical protein
VSHEVKQDGVWFRVVLDKSKKLVQDIVQAVKEKLARASSGSAPHLARVDKDGHIREWPVVELSIFDTRDGKQPANNYAVVLPVAKAIYKQASIDFPDEFANIDSHKDTTRGSGDEGDSKTQLDNEVIKMDEKELQALKDAGRKELQAEIDAENAKQKAITDGIAEGIKAEKALLVEAAELAKKEADEKAKADAEKRRLPDRVSFNKNSDISKFDNLDAGDQAVMIGIIEGAGKHASDSAYKALAMKMEGDKTDVGLKGSRMLKARGLKADEVMYSTLSGFGDEWVGVAYSSALWQNIRADSKVVSKIPSIEVPAGHESITIPLEGADPTYYKVAQVNDTDATQLQPNPTITSSQMATSNGSLTLAKMGARVLWSGELQEDSIVPFVNQLRSQLTQAGIEQLEHAVIDGDTAAGASANINDIAGTPAASDLFLMFNGFRKSPLVTTTANSRDGGVLTADDYLKTAKLMGTAGLGGADIKKVSFIVDPNTYWKSLDLPEVKTRDVFANPTIENGQLTGIYGFDLFPSWNMHYKNASRLANTAGKVDVDTAGNNTKGAILAVRWDQWLMGFRRRMTMETTRVPSSDSYEIVALARMGLLQRDTEASSISYNITI